MDKSITTATISVIEQRPMKEEPITQIEKVEATDMDMAASVLNPKCAVKSIPASIHDPEKIRQISISEYKEAAMCLAEAFRVDAVARYFIDTPGLAHWTEEQKWNLHLQILEYATYAHCLKGKVMTIGPNYSAVALWMPPGKNMDDLLTILRSGIWRLYYKLCHEGRTRFFTEFLPLLHDTKASVLGSDDDKSWYLVYLGTRPTARGHGYGQRLIKGVSEIADREGRKIYLESSNVRNVPLYKRLGFVEKKRIAMVRGGQDVEMDIMVRDSVKEE